MQSASITAKAEPAVSSHVGRQQCFRIYKQKRFLWIMAHRLFNKGSLQRQYLVLLTTKGRQRIPFHHFCGMLYGLAFLPVHDVKDATLQFIFFAGSHLQIYGG